MKEKKATSTIISLVFGYVFLAVGLVLIVIGSSGLINLFLQTVVFTSARQDMYLYQPPMPYYTEKITLMQTCEDVTLEDKALMEQWLIDYERWSEESTRIGRNSLYHEQASRNIALLIVGIPLFLWSFRFVKKRGF